MTKELDKNFKRVFSFELLLHRIENTKASNEQYSKILLEKTVTGLVAQGKIKIRYVKKDKTDEKQDYEWDYLIEQNNGETTKELAEKLNVAKQVFQEISKKMGQARSDVTGRSYLDGQILAMCNLIDTVLLPVCISEGLLDMSDTIQDLVNQYAQMRTDDDGA